jgi:hypothetical protein
MKWHNWEIKVCLNFENKRKAQDMKEAATSKKNAMKTFPALSPSFRNRGVVDMTYKLHPRALGRSPFSVQSHSLHFQSFIIPLAFYSLGHPDLSNMIMPLRREREGNISTGQLSTGFCLVSIQELRC